VRHVPQPRSESPGFESLNDVERHLPARPVSVGRLMARFAIAGVLALVLAAAFTAAVSRRIGTDQAVADAQRVSWVSARGIIEPAISDDVLTGDPAELARLDAVVREYVLRGSLVRVKLWSGDGTILYSDEPRLIGRTFELDADELELLAGGPAVAEVSDLDEPENQFETDDKLLEVYQRVTTPDGTPLVFEAYFRYSGVTASGRELWSRFAPIAIGALVALELVQIPLAWSLARRLRSGQVQRERLLRHAIAASDDERRRIASDLHDGVVQDLTGVSYSLAAKARAGSPNDDELNEHAGTIRDSVKSLRSLLVEIYPPNLHEEGLESAIADLLARLRNRGIETRLDVDADVPLSSESAALLYRSAQEALRNVVTHANARTASVAVRRNGDRVVMTVDDDGRGFDRSEMTEQADAGHVGLRSLADLMADAGGALEVLSTPGTGTRVRAEVPVR
jgi:signal transduction histidine kinase